MVLLNVAHPVSTKLVITKTAWIKKVSGVLPGSVRLAFIILLTIPSCGSDSARKIGPEELIGGWDPLEKDGRDVEGQYPYLLFQHDQFILMESRMQARTAKWQLTDGTLYISWREGSDAYRIGVSDDEMTLVRDGGLGTLGNRFVCKHRGSTSPRSSSNGGFPLLSLLSFGDSFLVVLLGLIILLVYLRWLAVKDKNLMIRSRWHHLFENMSESSEEFYKSLEETIKSRIVPDLELSRIQHHEGGVISAKREYLRVKRNEHLFDICAAPFGTGFFFSWWLGERPSTFWMLVMLIPLLGPWLFNTFRPYTYYRLDTETMFQESVRKAVLEVLDGITTAKGVRALSELERKPIMTELLKR